MKTITKTIDELPSSLAESHKLILSLQQELAAEKIKYGYLIEQIRLAKQERFASSSEKNIYQADLFDEAGIESEEIEEQQETIEIKNYSRKKTSHQEITAF